MATLCVMLEESDREIKPPPAMKGFHFCLLRLDGLVFSDEEVASYSQALGMTLLAAVRENQDVSGK